MELAIFTTGKKLLSHLLVVQEPTSLMEKFLPLSSTAQVIRDRQAQRVLLVRRVLLATLAQSVILELLAVPEQLAQQVPPDQLVLIPQLQVRQVLLATLALSVQLDQLVRLVLTVLLLVLLVTLVTLVTLALPGLLAQQALIQLLRVLQGIPEIQVKLDQLVLELQVLLA
jgi:hypothetical protein